MRRAADAIRRDALERTEGDMLGSEDELLARYGVSRPTLRQSAALVVQENLLVVKRGVSGGYFVRQPDSKAVAHVAAVYLRSRRTAADAIVPAFAPIRIEVAKLAARCEDEGLKTKLRQFLEADERRDQVSFGEFVRAEREFGRLMSEMSGNEVISLFLEILYDCSSLLSPDEDLFRNHPDRVEEYRGKRNKLAVALLDGDEEIAVLAASRLTAATAEWMISQLERREPKERLIAVPGLGDPTPVFASRRRPASHPAEEAPASPKAPVANARAPRK
jgi:DNA-binding FadR family transcriptional regulator